MYIYLAKIISSFYVNFATFIPYRMSDRRPDICLLLIDVRRFSIVRLSVSDVWMARVHDNSKLLADYFQTAINSIPYI